MSDPLLEERIEILRRIAEKGLHAAARQWVLTQFLSKPWNSQIDLWQHMLDEIGRLKP